MQRLHPPKFENHPFPRPSLPFPTGFSPSQPVRTNPKFLILYKSLQVHNSGNVCHLIRVFNVISSSGTGTEFAVELGQTVHTVLSPCFVLNAAWLCRNFCSQISARIVDVWTPLQNTLGGGRKAERNQAQHF